MDNMTFFATPERTTGDNILKESDLVNSQKFFTELFGAMTGVGAVVDKNRQIVFTNDEFLKMLGINSLVPILGKRPGEAISCAHSEEEPAGCGTSQACAYCGVINTFLESQKTGKKAMSEARISSIVDGKNKSWDLNVMSTPVTFNDSIFYVLILQDIGEAKRRAALERIFFHDLLNSVGGLYGLLTVLKDETDPDQRNELINLSEDASRNIIEEIMMQRQLRAAEEGDLKVSIEHLNSIDLLDSVIGKMGFSQSDRSHKVLVDPESQNLGFETDRNLLQRVMINLIKNALEATEIDGKVIVGVESVGNQIIFWVKNDLIIPEDIQLQLFQRSFSTKGTGRGLGTYSIRLLTENYLKGRVSFISNERTRTVFRITLNTEYPSDSEII